MAANMTSIYVTWLAVKQSCGQSGTVEHPIFGKKSVQRVENLTIHFSKTVTESFNFSRTNVLHIKVLYQTPLLFRNPRYFDLRCWLIPNNICPISISGSFRLKKTEKPWDRARLSHVTYRVCAVSIMTSSYNFITASCIKRWSDVLLRVNECRGEFCQKTTDIFTFPSWPRTKPVAKDVPLRPCRLLWITITA